MTEPSRVTRERTQRPDPHEKLVKVFDAEQESEAMVVKGLLDSAGIDSDMTALSAPQDTFPGVGGTIILVREEDAKRAAEVIAESQRTAADASGISDETAEFDTTQTGISGGPPARE